MVVFLVRCSAAFASWRKSELQEKLGSCLPYMEHYTLSQMQTLYIPRNEGGRGLIAIEDCVEVA